MEETRMKKRCLSLLLAAILLLGLKPGLAVLQKPYAEKPSAEVWRSYEPELHYYYQLLTPAERRLFSARYDAVALGDASLWNYLLSSYNWQNIQKVNFALLYDCPELMYIPPEMHDTYLSLQAPPAAYCASHPENMRRMLEECNKALETIKQRPEWGDSEYEKQLALDRYLCERCAYGVRPGAVSPLPLSADERICTAYAALREGTANCMGYANAACYALRRFGISCIVNIGTISDQTGHSYGHMWNVVQIEGRWYHYDPTWNDSYDGALYDDYKPYFNITTIEIRRTPSPDPAPAQLGFKNPVCDATACNYYVYNGRMLGEDWQYRLNSMVQYARDNGQRSLGVRFESAQLLNEALEFIASPLNKLNPKWKFTRLRHFTHEDVCLMYFTW